jgi:hypothetical protein
MKKIFLILALLGEANAQNMSRLDIDALTNLLGIDGLPLKIENVTERESKVRNMPLESAWLIHSPEKTLIPIMIYTSKKGILYAEDDTRLLESIEKNPPNEGEFGFGMGPIEIPDLDRCMVFIEEIPMTKYVMNDSSRDQSAGPWREGYSPGLAITGTFKNSDRDFQIFLVMHDEDELNDFPRLQSILHGPDFLSPKPFGTELFHIIKQSDIFIGDVMKAPNSQVDSFNRKSSDQQPEYKDKPRVVDKTKLWSIIIIMLVVTSGIFFHVSKRSR